MNRSMFIIIVVLLGFSFATCKNGNSFNGATEVESKKGVKNMISIVEIPVTNLARAVVFYQTILGVTIEKMTMEDTEMGVLPAGNGSVNVVLIKGNDYVPTNNGALVYLNVGNDLQITLDKVEKSGGKIILPKTQISPEMGFYALFLDTEGNKLGMHSQN
ncbi:VOC family protein [Leptospira sp. 201903074]|uniref:VOC family protein n=1 Tax=Leptospira abararensis TaxID=2810036 RepID=UPI0019631688|nr:VOC family protein [Leptospira abararensis]MBM9545886.1 VOC family protein [Leptospira abararensis]